jgi:hypothetical protein
MGVVIKAVEQSPLVRLSGEDLPLPPDVSVPADPEELKLWGSNIRWPGLYVNLNRYRGKTVFKWYVPVSCGACGGEHERRVFRVRGTLNADCLRDPRRSYERCSYTGLCASCLIRLLRVNQPDLALPDGSVLSFVRRTKEGLPFFCGGCRQEQLLKCELAVDVFLSDADWYCPGCAHLIGEHQHRTGATVHWLKRRKEDRKIKIDFRCIGCKELRYTRDHTIQSDVWMGRCDDCHMHPRTITGTRETALGAVVPFDNREGQTVTVKCPIPGCPGTTDWPVGTAKKKGFLGICRRHSKADIALAYMSAGLGEPNGGEFFERFLEAVTAVAMRWTVVCSYTGLTFEKRLEMVTQKDIGPLVGVHQGKGEIGKNFDNRVARKLEALGVVRVFPGGRGRFRTFVEAVARGLKEGDGPRKVARLLWFQKPELKKTA